MFRRSLIKLSDSLGQTAIKEVSDSLARATRSKPLDLARQAMLSTTPLRENSSKNGQHNTNIASETGKPNSKGTSTNQTRRDSGYEYSIDQDDRPVAQGIRFKRIKSESDVQFQAKKKNYYAPFAEARGISVEKYDELLDQHSQNFLPKDKKVCMRINAHDLKDILRRKDSFKSLHVTNTSSGLLDPEARRAAEKDRLGNYNERLAGKFRPIHGYIAKSTQLLGPYDRFFKRHFTDKYGDAVIVFKDEIMQRTSFTVGDSLDYSDVRAVPIENPNGNCFPLGLPIIAGEGLKKPDSLASKMIKLRDPLNKKFEDCIPYLDAQIHYGAFLRDVEGYILTSRAAQDKELIDLLEEANACVEIVTQPPED